MDPAELKEWRKSIGKTQAEVAALLGVTRGHYALIEQGRARASEKKVMALVSVMKAPPTPAPKKIAERRLPIVPLGTPELHQVASKIINAALKGRVSSSGEFLNFYARVVQALG